MKTKTVIECIDKYLDQGLTDKQTIYSEVVTELEIPRPTVRRAAQTFRQILIQQGNESDKFKIEILSQNVNFKYKILNIPTLSKKTIELSFEEYKKIVDTKLETESIY